MSFSVYILRCVDKTLYTGVAKDVKKELKNIIPMREELSTRELEDL